MLSQLSRLIRRSTWRLSLGKLGIRWTEENKSRHYTVHIQVPTQGVRYVALAAHNIGIFSEQAVKEIKIVAGAMARSQGENDSAIIIQRLSLVIQ